GLDEEAHEAEADAVLFLERLLVLRPQRQDGAHVGLVERRQDRGVLLRLEEAFRDALADRRHAHASLTAVGLRRRERGRGNERLRFRRPRLQFRFVGFQKGEHVLFDDATAAACPGQRRRLDAGIGGRLARGGRQDWFRLRFRRRGHRVGRRLRLGALRLGFGFRFRRWLRVGRGGRGVDLAHDGPDGDALALLRADDQDTGGGGHHLGRGLVGLDLEDRFVRLDARAVGFEPARDGALADRFADRRDFDIDG